MASNTTTRRQLLCNTLKAGAATMLAAPMLPMLSRGAQAQSDANPWRIGCYTRPWSAFEYQFALDAIKEAGFQYAGLMTAKSKSNLVISVETTVEEAATIGEECKSRGLIVPSVYGGDIPVAQSLEAGIAGLRRLIDCCAAARIENLMMGGVGDDALYPLYFKAIAECCPYADEKHIGISMKPHGGLNATGPQCRKALETVAHKNFRVWYDPGNIYYYSDGKLDPVDDASTVDGLVVGMSVKDFQDPKEVMLTPGTGRVDFPKVMARLIAGGFSGGPLIVECLKPGEPAQLLEEAKKARLFVETLMKQMQPVQ